MGLTDRLRKLEQAVIKMPWLTLDVHGMPTPEQLATIADCERIGRTVMVFCEPGNTLWTPGAGTPPWEETDAQH